MAGTSSKPSFQFNACHGVGLLCLFLVVPLAAATQVKVGGSMGWTVPSDPRAYNKWAGRMRFRIGDSLLFTYPPDKDSVLHVSKEDYESCNTKSPLERFDDGNTVFMFNHSGPYYFISGVEENCLKNESMVVVVMADRSKPNTPPSPSPESPPPSPAPESTSPPPAPESSSPPPAPESSSPPSPPSSPPAIEVVPSPPPSSAPPPPPPNSAQLKAVGAVSAIGGVLGLFMFFVL